MKLFFFVPDRCQLPLISTYVHKFNAFIIIIVVVLRFIWNSFIHQCFPFKTVRMRSPHWRRTQPHVITSIKSVEEESDTEIAAATTTNFLCICTHGTLKNVYWGSFCAVLQLFSLALFPFVSTTARDTRTHLQYTLICHIQHTNTPSMHTVKGKQQKWKKNTQRMARLTQVFPHTVGLVSASKGNRLFAKYSNAIHAIVCRIAFSHHTQSSGQVKIFSCEFSKFSTKAKRKINFDRIYKCIHESNR